MPFDSAPERDWEDEPEPILRLTGYCAAAMLNDGTLIGGEAVLICGRFHWRWVDRPRCAVPRMVMAMFPDAGWIRAPAPRRARVGGPAWFRTTVR